MSKFHSIRNARGNAAIAIFGVIVIAALAYFLYNPLKTIADLLSENNKLKKAITSLTDENQIGYAKVIKQETKNGKLFFETLSRLCADREKPAYERDC